MSALSAYNHQIKTSARILFLLCVYVILSPFGPYALASGLISIKWDANTEPNIAGYKVYHGNAPGNYGYPLDVGNTTSYQISNLDAQTKHYFTVIAYDSRGKESSPSSEVYYDPNTNTTNSPSDPTGNESDSSSGDESTSPGSTYPDSGSYPDNPVMPTSPAIDQRGWSLLYTTSQELTRENGAGLNAFDGNPQTIWHTEWSRRPAPTHPHDFVLDLGADYFVDGFRYLPRQDGTANGRIGRYEFYIRTESGMPSTPPVAGEWTRVATGTFANDQQEKAVVFSSHSSRYVWLRAVDEAQGVNNPWASMAELNVLGTPRNIAPPIDQRGWSLLYTTSQELARENGAALNAFDGNPQTIWHTEWSRRPAPTHPHDFVLDLGANYLLDGFRYLPRQDGTANGRIGRYEFYVRAETGTPSMPPVAGEWTRVATGTFANDQQEKAVVFSSHYGRYVWLRAVDEAQGANNPWASMAELNVLGTPRDVAPPIDQRGWSLLYTTSQELARENGAALNAFDGNPQTIWHTEWSRRPAPTHPHDFVLDLGANYLLDGFRYLPRQDGTANGRIGRYEFYVRAETGTPSMPPVAGEWTRVATGAFANTQQEKEIVFSSRYGRYVWLRAVDEAQGVNNPWASMAELNVLGRLQW